jgi:hypothetical protein
MDTSPPNNEEPATWKSRVSSKTNLNNDADIVAQVPQGRKCKTAVFDHDHRGAPILLNKDSAPLIDGHFSAVERADLAGHTFDADRREKIANWFEQLKGQLPSAARKIVESSSHEGLPKTGEVYYHRGSAGSCPRGYARGRYYLFYGRALWEFLQARYHEVRVSLECRGFATKRIAGKPSEVDQQIARVRRESAAQIFLQKRFG